MPKELNNKVKRHNESHPRRSVSDHEEGFWKSHSYWRKDKDVP